MPTTIVAFEGLMCVGKTSTIRWLRDRMPAAMCIPEVMPDPLIAREPPCPIHPGSERFIRSDWAKSRAISAAHDGPVLMDRYFVSTVAYLLSQRRARPTRANVLAEWNRLYGRAHLPDVWVFLDERPDRSFARARAVRPEGMTGEWGTLAGLERQRALALCLLEVLGGRGHGRVEVIRSDETHRRPELLRSSLLGNDVMWQKINQQF